MTPEQRDKHLKTIDKIENMKRPEKWRAIRKFVLELHPELVDVEHDHAEACKELRLKNSSKTASSKSGTMRQTMILFKPVYDALIKLDPEILIEMSGRNRGPQIDIAKLLYDAFPEYRTARKY